jgi:hypothetical protein
LETALERQSSRIFNRGQFLIWTTANPSRIITIARVVAIPLDPAAKFFPFQLSPPDSRKNSYTLRTTLRRNNFRRPPICPKPIHSFLKPPEQWKQFAHGPDLPGSPLKMGTGSELTGE